jgi:hypothetical protein
MLNLHETAGDHPEAQAVRDAVFRGLARPEGRGLLKHLQKATRRRTLVTPTGLIAGRRVAYDVSLKRLDRVVARTLRGLYYKEKGYRLPDGFEATVYSEDGLSDLGVVEAARLKRELIEPALQTTPRVFGQDVFRYWMANASDHPHATGWVFTFYSRVHFVGVTLPVERHRT